mmetsp:Transcript_37276/g.46049  ORF Transcript_37276/g.46049 Transcript_37276/m.46049 type:complete len:106 (+) Transcript_37276:568-885(+)
MLVSQVATGLARQATVGWTPRPRELGPRGPVVFRRKVDAAPATAAPSASCRPPLCPPGGVVPACGRCTEVPMLLTAVVFGKDTKDVISEVVHWCQNCGDLNPSTA